MIKGEHTMEFITRDGTKLIGTLVHQYRAFEGGMRYILVNNGKEYRCIKDELGRYIEYAI